MDIAEFAGKCGFPIALYTWDDVAAPDGILQVAHGIGEHMARYDDLARFLNGHGFIVIGQDNRANGLTAPSVLGLSGGDCFPDTVEDMIMVTRYAKEKYPGLPFFLFGHSYGSFLVQRYIEKASVGIDGVILCGTALFDGARRRLGALVSKLMKADKPARLVNKLSFDKYDKLFRFEDENSGQEAINNRWLSRDTAEVIKYNDDPLCGVSMSYGFYASFFKGLKEVYRSESLSSIRKDLPILIMGGDNDALSDFGKLLYGLYKKYLDAALKKVSIKLYGGARHELLNETNRNEVFDDISAFLYNSI